MSALVRSQALIRSFSTGNLSYLNKVGMRIQQLIIEICRCRKAKKYCNPMNNAFDLGNCQQNIAFCQFPNKPKSATVSCSM